MSTSSTAAQRTRILVIRCGRLGDMVMITPALSVLKEAFPEAEFDLLTSPEGARMRDYFPLGFAVVHVYDRKRWHQALQVPKLVQDIRARGYSRIFCLETNPTYRKFCAAVPGAQAYYPPQNSIHSAELALFTVCCCEAVSLQQKTMREYPVSLQIPSKYQQGTTEHLQQQYAIDEDTFVLALHPSFSGQNKPNKIFKRWKHKKWSTQHYIALAKQLQGIWQAANQDSDQAMPFQLVMNLLPEEQKLAQRIEEGSSGVLKNIELPPGLGYFFAYLHRVDLLILPDTGPMHIAAAYATNLIALFSGEHPQRCGPWRQSNGIITIRAEEQPGAKSGINRITPDTVAQVAQENMPSFLANAYRQRSRQAVDSGNTPIFQAGRK